MQGGKTRTHPKVRKAFCQRSSCAKRPVQIANLFRNSPLVYDSKEHRVFDVRPYISGNWFGKLKDEQYFRTVRISGNTVEWQGGQDIAPHELYELSYLL